MGSWPTLTTKVFITGQAVRALIAAVSDDFVAPGASLNALTKTPAH